MTCRGSQQSHIAYAVDALLLPRPPILYPLSGNKKAAPKDGLRGGRICTYVSSIKGTPRTVLLSALPIFPYAYHSINHSLFAWRQLCCTLRRIVFVMVVAVVRMRSFSLMRMVYVYLLRPLVLIVEIDSAPRIRGGDPSPVVVDGIECPGMAELTGYGTATGLKGVNCRHTIEVYVPGETEPPDTEFKEDSALHNGMTSEEYYQAVQGQRALERAVRGTRYQVAMMEKMGMGLEHPSYVQKRLELGNWQAKLAKHCKANNLTRIPSREQAYGIGKQPKGLTGRKLSGAATVEHLKPSRYGKTDPLNVKGIPQKLMNRQIEEIDRIASRIPILDESLKRYGLDLYSSSMNGVVYTTMRDGKWRIVYSSETFASRASASAAVSAGIKDGYYMPSSKANRAVYPIAHELGHILQKSIAENEIGKGYSDVDYEMFADSCKAEILKIANELGRGRHDSVSKYANKNPRDFFAECFANACCGKVNVYGESVVEYLKRRGYLDEK